MIDLLISSDQSIGLSQHPPLLGHQRPHVLLPLRSGIGVLPLLARCDLQDVGPDGEVDLLGCDGLDELRVVPEDDVHLVLELSEQKVHASSFTSVCVG